MTSPTPKIETTQEATARPWGLGAGVGSELSHSVFGDAGLQIICDCDFSSDVDRSAANAALIVRAVNSHDALIEALQAVLADIAEYERINNLAPNPGRKDCWQSVTRARAALKLSGAA